MTSPERRAVLNAHDASTPAVASPERCLQVGVETSCKAPLFLERAKLRVCRLMGVDSLFLPDHLMSATPHPLRAVQDTPSRRWVTTADAFFEPFIMLGALAMQHPRARLGIGVTDPLRRHPASLAQAFVTLDHLTRGRAILGIGAGARENIEPYGLPFSREVARVEEALSLVRRLWSSGGQPIDFDGATWRLRRATLGTPLYSGRPPALWVAAHAPRMLAVAGRYGDGWYPAVKLCPDEYRAQLQIVRRAAAAAGRSFEHFEPALQLPLVLGRDRGTVINDILRTPAAAGLALSLPANLWKRHGLTHPLARGPGPPQFLGDEVTEAHLQQARRAATRELLADGVAAGNVREVCGEVAALVKAGLRHVVIANIGPGFRGLRVPDVLALAVLVRQLRRLRLTSVQGLAMVSGGDGE